MSIYDHADLKSMTSFMDQLKREGRKEFKKVSRAQSELSISEEQCTLVSALTGFGLATGVATDARYAALAYNWERTYDALYQIRAADPRMELEFQRFTLNSDNMHSRRADNLVGHKRALEPQLKRNYDAYLAKFAVLRQHAHFSTVVNVIGLNLNADRTSPRPKRRISRDRPLLEPSFALSPSGKRRHLAICTAEFWTQRSGEDTDELTIDQETNLLVYRGLLRTERVCFGYGVGKKAMKRIVQQIVARAAADDVLDRSPLQPEGIASFLASLPIDEDGTTATLPPIKLP